MDSLNKSCREAALLLPLFIDSLNKSCREPALLLPLIMDILNKSCRELALYNLEKRIWTILPPALRIPVYLSNYHDQVLTLIN
jgi:hypothetical protein